LKGLYNRKGIVLINVVNDHNSVGSFDLGFYLLIKPADILSLVIDRDDNI
jgi:hypothetical protein